MESPGRHSGRRRLPRGPLSSAHSIWEIVAHMTFWEGVVIQRLHGKRAGLVEELNFPPTPAPTEENWRKTLEEFRNSNRSIPRGAQSTLILRS